MQPVQPARRLNLYVRIDPLLVTSPPNPHRGRNGDETVILSAIEQGDSESAAKLLPLVGRDSRSK
jgi:hypothetical protein